MSVTDERRAGYPARHVPVTCVKCGADIPPDRNMLVAHVTSHREGIRQGDRVCAGCVDELVKACRPYYCYHVPWEGDGVRGKRTRGEYQHWCDRCGRPFMGALARRYCSDECGQRTRAERRDRTRDRESRRCVVCGDPFTPPRADGRYCSPACRQKAYRRRKAG